MSAKNRKLNDIQEESKNNDVKKKHDRKFLKKNTKESIRKTTELFDKKQIKKM